MSTQTNGELGAAVSAAGRSAPGLARVVAIAAVLAGVVLLAFFQVNDTDVFWQIKVGERVLATGETVAQLNYFSSTFPDYPYYNPEWLFQVMLAVVHARGGWQGVMALKLALVALLAATLFARLLKVCDAPATAAALTLAALATMRSRLTERPQLASLLFFCLMLLMLEGARRGRPRLLWGLVPLFALWSNVHGELLLGLLVLFGAATGEWLQRHREGGPAVVAPHRLAAVGLACFAASLLNPGGVRILWQGPGHFSLGSILEIAEFSFSSPRDVPLFWVVLAAVLIALLRRRGRIDWAEAIPLAGVALLSIRYRREIPYFAMGALPLLQRALTAEGGKPWVRRAGGLAAGLLAAGCLIWAMRYDRILTYRWGWGINTDIFPAAAADFIARAQLPPGLYNHYNVGGYLLYRLSPPYGVFQDSRGAYPVEFLAALHAQHGGEASRGLLERFGVNTALIWSFEAKYLLPRQEWAVVYWDDRHCVLVRRAPQHEPLLARLEYRRYLPWGDDADFGDPRALEALAAEMRRNERERGAPSAAVAADLGIVLGRMQRYEDARTELARAVALNPDNASAWAYLGLAQAQRGDQAQARESWHRALALDPAQDIARRGLGRPPSGGMPRSESR